MINYQVKPCRLALMSANFYCVEKPEKFSGLQRDLNPRPRDTGASHRYRDVAGSNPVEVLKIFQTSRRNRNLRSSLRDNMVSLDFIPAVQDMMYFIYIFHI